MISVLRRDELTNKHYPLKSRLKLFDATVGATILYGCEAWTLKKNQQNRLKTIQRKMLRMILGAKRKKMPNPVETESDRSNEEERPSSTSNSVEMDEDEILEPWPDFLRRTARLVESKMEAAGLEEWLVTWRRRQWRFAGKLVRDNKHKWSYIALQWDPQLHSRARCGRAQGRPRKRWEQDLIDFTFSRATPGCWKIDAEDSHKWAALEKGFVVWACPK
jgi:hypothetical protein